MTGDIDLDPLVSLVSRSRIAMFIGRNDTGKSTLIKRIAQELDVSVIDADIGQSDIGPPTVVSLGERHNERYKMLDGYFCGSTTPAKHFLPLLAGTSRMAKRIKRFPALVNTTGLATGAIGRMLKTEKINALDPDVIIGIGIGLEYLDAFERTGATVMHLPVSTAVRQKSHSERTALRQNAFKEHFSGARMFTYPFKKFAVERSLLFNGTTPEVSDDILHVDVSDDEALVIIKERSLDIEALMNSMNVSTVHVYTPDDFMNVLVGLMDDHGKLLGLGLINAMDFERKEICLYTAVKAFSVLQFGSIKLSMKDFSYAGSFSGESRLRKH